MNNKIDYNLENKIWELAKEKVKNVSYSRYNNALLKAYKNLKEQYARSH